MIIQGQSCWGTPLDPDGKPIREVTMQQLRIGSFLTYGHEQDESSNYGPVSIGVDPGEDDDLVCYAWKEGFVTRISFEMKDVPIDCFALLYGIPVVEWSIQYEGHLIRGEN